MVSKIVYQTSLRLLCLLACIFLASCLSRSNYEGYQNLLFENKKGNSLQSESYSQRMAYNFHELKNSFRNLLQDVTDTNLQSEKAPQARMAYFMLMSRNERAKVVNLLKKINAPQNIYLIHMDKKMHQEEVQNVIADIQELNQTYNNFYLLHQYQVSYMGIATVDIDLTAMAYALSLPTPWTHYMSISPSDYPLLTQDQISTLLGQFPPDVSILQAQLMQCGFIDNRIRKFWFDGAMVGVPNNQNYLIMPKFPLRKDLKYLKGSQWKLLSREMAKYFVYSEDGWARRMLLYFSGSLAPNEHYYETTACNSPNPNVRSMVRIGQVTYKSWHDIDWEERLKHGVELGPNSMNEKYLNWALNKGGLFARKFQMDEESQHLKDLLDRMHDGEQINLLNDTFTKQTYFQRTVNYFKEIIEAETCSKLLKKEQNCSFDSY